ncbi:hypothetical protein CA237_16320 [Sphingomonas sp. ABOLH]|nr:MAG: hypothetical protein DI625_11300 [Sphingomonas sp.]RSV21427.1 hypothetical protein CA237_16320 [Sphingomonas sp. ABOLH]
MPRPIRPSPASRRPTRRTIRRPPPPAIRRRPRRRRPARRSNAVDAKRPARSDPGGPFLLFYSLPLGSSSFELVEKRPSRTCRRGKPFSTLVLDRLEPALEANGVDW